MLRKAVLLFAIAVAGWCRLSAYDPIDTVWTIQREYSFSYYDVSPDDRYVVAVLPGSNGHYYGPLLYDAESGSFIREMEGWKSELYTGLLFSPDSRYVITSGIGHRGIAVFDTESGQFIREINNSGDVLSIGNYSFSPTGDTLLYLRTKYKTSEWDNNHSIMFVDFETGDSLFERSVFFEEGYLPEKITYSPRGDQVLYQFEYADYFYIDYLNTNTRTKYTIDCLGMYIGSVNYSPDGSKIIISGEHGLIEIINSSDRSLIKSLYMLGDSSEHYYCGDAILMNRNDYMVYYYQHSIDLDIIGYGTYIFNYTDSSAFKYYKFSGLNLKVSSDDQYIYNNSRRMIKIRIDWTPQSYYDPGAGKGEKSKTVVKPNPVSGKAALSLSNLAPEACEIELYDTQGRLVRKLFSGTPEGETMDLEFDTGGLTAGSYLCTIVLKSGKKTVKFIIEE